MVRIVHVQPTEQDLEAIARIDRECFPDDEPVELENTVWWLAFDGSRAVAFAGAKYTHDDRGYLCRAGVLRCARGQGLQRRLIRAREKWARANRLQGLVAYTSSDNTPSSNNLIACGFRLYRPAWESGLDGALYWYKSL